MIDRNQKSLPELFGRLMELGCFSEGEIYATSDGLYAVTASIADILAQWGIMTVQGSQGDLLDCSLFFDDWYLYAVSCENDYTYGLFKMREQEYDAEMGLNADGDTPGVTISFVELQTNILFQCLHKPTTQNRVRLNEEINRVVACGGQSHSEVLKQYFIRTEAQGAYLIAKLYTGYIASLAENGYIPVTERYACDYRKRGARGRVPRFIEENNREAGKVICDHERICIGDHLCPTERERLAILATHTGNTSF